VASFPFLTISYFYRTHLRWQPQTFGHLGDFYFDPMAGESRIEFLLKNLHSTLDYFLPIQIPNRGIFLGALALLLLAAIAFALARTDRIARLGYRAAILMPILLLLQLMILGVARKYPFGGEMRQQSILAPFLCLSLFLLLDRLLSITPSAGLRRALLAVAAIAITASAYLQWKTLPRSSQQLFTEDYRQFLAAVPAPQTIYMDQFSVTAYYTHTHNWDWRADHQQRSDEQFEEYRVIAPGGRSTDIIRDRRSWNLDFRGIAAYQTIACVLHGFHKPSLSVFHLQQMGSPMPAGSEQQRWDQVQNLAGQVGLKATTLHVQGADFFATFEPLTPGGQPRP
jgi:hypothetical protein